MYKFEIKKKKRDMTTATDKIIVTITTLHIQHFTYYSI